MTTRTRPTLQRKPDRARLEMLIPVQWKDRIEELAEAHDSTKTDVVIGLLEWAFDDFSDALNEKAS